MSNNETELNYAFPEERLSNDHVVLLLIFYSAVIIIGVIGNVSLLAALLSSGAARLRTPQLLSVCLADLLVCGVSAPLAAVRMVPSAQPPSLFTNFAEVFPVTASTLLLTNVAIDRYVTVQRPLFMSRTCTRPFLTTLVIWLLAIALSCGVLYSDYSTPEVKLALNLIHIIVAFCTPMFVIAACHLSVRARLTALSLTARAAHGELPLPVPLIRKPTHVIIVAGVGGPRERRDAFDAGDGRPDRRRRRAPQPSLLGPQPLTSTLRSRRRLANVLVGVAAMFAACWCLHALLAVAQALGSTPPAALRRYALLIGHSHSALHAAAYWVLNRHALTAACAAWKLPEVLRGREERPSSTNEAALGAFHPRFARPAPAPRPPPSSYLF